MTQIHHTGLTVSDLDRALRFWRDAVGAREVLAQEQEGGYFEAIVREPGVRVRMAHLELEPGGPRIELFQFDTPAGGTHRMRPADVGFAHVCLLTDELDALLGRLEDAGGRRFADPVDVDRGANAGARAVYVRDPDGHVVELFQRAPTAEG
jgi:catechol 2,3-dioxygenase-like lactoylglutathione lyase family enzyme